ncbi:cysteine desulfurase-like protein [Tsukamurella sp. 8F]|uniref:cysteine desulfurase-like protein n=1 Tax=unclassified Tsukamurella TaxID=2633480 RepID=UPI0023BA1DE9|nr:MULTISPECIES: cysteine desulfurase-like protein [unclassified Tsukamurella]MDF0531811.1 cysteine desulfurase-like protein [Tsukamurella sp. 8J]MDF0589053.1 cysteine desulfurase-like protein [Tsukamurella sp. 8F]
MSFDVARVRGLFPALGDGWIHFDPQAGAQIPATVASAVASAFRGFVSQPSGVYPGAAHTATIVTAARTAVADLVNAPVEGVVLGSTREQLLGALAEAMSTRVWLGSEVVLGRLDDEENITPWLRLADRVGATVRWAEADIETGEVPSWQYEQLVNSATSVVATTLASSTIGTTVDVSAAAQAARSVGALLVVDATSAASYEVIDLETLGADVVVVSANRWGGPQAAALAFRDPTVLERLRAVAVDPRARGPERLEAGEHSYAMLGGLVASIDHLAGLDEAASGTRRERLQFSLRSVRDYQQRLLRYLLASLETAPQVSVIGTASRRIPTVSFTVPGVPAQKAAKRLADNGICALCDVPSRFFDGLGVPEYGGAVTVGLGVYSTPYDVDQLVRALGSLA